MNSVWEGLPDDVRSALADIEHDADPISRCHSCRSLLEEVIDRMKLRLRIHDFSDREEEIRYFKLEAPPVYGAHMYYLKLLDLEMTGLYLDRKRFKALLETELQATDAFFARHAELLRYAETNDPSWQACLFTRRGQGEWLPEETAVYIGEDMTLGSYRLSRKRASGALRWWIYARLASLEDEETGSFGVKNGKTNITWTAAVVDLAELVYALHLKGCFIHGKTTLKDAMEWFADRFDVNLDNFHSRLSELGRRKKVDKFLRELASILNEKYDSKL